MKSTHIHLISKQLGLVSQLTREIYPIQNNSICGLNLPTQMTLFTTQSKENMAAVLGIVGHFVMLIAWYLQVPLRYKITLGSSRTIISDPITTSTSLAASVVASGGTLSRNLDLSGNIYPLYPGERERFEYGVFLLNKNIQQIMSFCGVKCTSLRNTIENLLKLVVYLEQMRIGLESVQDQAGRGFMSPTGGVDWKQVQMFGDNVSIGRDESEGFSTVP